MKGLITLDKNYLGKQRLEREWENFICGTNPSPDIRSMTHDSWQRSLEFGICPLKSKTSIKMSDDQIKEYVTYDPLYRTIKPVLARLKDKYMDTGHMIVFCNGEGEIISIDGDLSLMLKAEDMNFVSGSSWAENNAGTNAIGTAIATGSPVEVFAGEHFCYEVQKWTCSAAPIRDLVTNDILGVIDMTGLWTANDPYFLSVVTSAAQDASVLLHNQLNLERFKLVDYYQSQMISHQSKSITAVIDRNWKVIKASQSLYELGLINSNNLFVRSPSRSAPLKLGTRWEVDHLNGTWRFELTPYIYGGIPIGGIVNVFPPSQPKGQAVTLAAVDCPKNSEITSLNFKYSKNQLDNDIKEWCKGTEFYKAIFDQNYDGIFLCDLDGNFLDVNASLERMIGYTGEELENRTLSSIVLPEFLEEGVGHIRKTMQGKSQEFESAIKHKKGYQIDLIIKSSPIFIDNKIVGIYGVVRDITKNKQIEEVLQLTRQQLDLFLKNTFDSIIIIDLQLNVIKVNEAFEKVFGWTEREVIGRLLPIIPEFLVDQCFEMFKEIVESGHVFSSETVRQRKDGSLIDVFDFISPIVNAKGQVSAFVCILRDISERKKMEEALKESEKRLRTLINAMPDVILFKDGEGRWLEANDYSLKSFQFQNIPYQGKTDSELAAYNEAIKKTLEFCEESDRRAWENRRNTRAEEVLPLANGESSIFDVIKVPIFYPDGKRKGLVIIGRDITDLKRTEELLRKSEKLAVVGQLATGIAHEIRNPLTSIKGFLSLFRSSPDKKNEEFLDIMLSEINRIECITNQFMAVAKPQAISIQFQDLNDLLEQVSVVILPEATMNNIQIRIETEPDIPFVPCDVNQLKQVFINIIKNAIEAMPMGGEIFIKITKSDDHQVHIRFIDQGCGIPQERIPYLGEPFYSLKEKGTGLGLMICYKIIKEHQGRILIESEINKGTTIDIILPIPL
ncbi:PAS domain S-box protein [Cytobacillus firmus]|uniref:PAS domain S-box protein n=1 Tax=Cytobacillus firmus TaxID=1399 RepID=UPI002186D9FA|nr:PAS domain S-box protein [Cytobacillus firmus]URM32262.1 PAS domain S-box protein [Cytobacillus firmus]